MYQDGQHIEQIKAATEAGDSKAAFDLGWCYYIGNGVAQDKSKAWHWYKEAASHGVREAAEILDVLEAEASRASELESPIQIEKQATLQGHRVRWVIVIVLVVACLGSVGTLLYVLRPDSTTGDAEAGIQRDKAITPASEPIRATENKEVVRERGPSDQREGLAAIPEAGDPDNAAGRETVVAIPEKDAEPKPQSPRPESPSAARESFLAEIARIAERWLEEPNAANEQN